MQEEAAKPQRDGRGPLCKNWFILVIKTSQYQQFSELGKKSGYIVFQTDKSSFDTLHCCDWGQELCAGCYVQYVILPESWIEVFCRAETIGVKYTYIQCGWFIGHCTRWDIPDLSAAIRTAPTRVPSLQVFSKCWLSFNMIVISKDSDVGYRPTHVKCFGPRVHPLD